MMGMTMVVGIVTEAAIFYYSEYQQLDDTLQGTERFIQAGVNRLRPLFMTTLVAIFALLPLALGIGEGSAMQQPLAIAISHCDYLRIGGENAAGVTGASGAIDDQSPSL